MVGLDQNKIGKFYNIFLVLSIVVLLLQCGKIYPFEAFNLSSWDF